MAKAFKAADAWVLELDDHSWYGGDDSLRTLLMQQALEEAKAQGCRSVAIFAIPDPIFPMYGHMGRHRVHTEVLPVADAPPYTISTMHRAEIPQSVWENTPEKVRPKLVRRVRDAVNERGASTPARYEIVIKMNSRYLILEEGRV